MACDGPETPGNRAPLAPPPAEQPGDPPDRLNRYPEAERSSGGARRGGTSSPPFRRRPSTGVILPTPSAKPAPSADGTAPGRRGESAFGQAILLLRPVAYVFPKDPGYRWDLAAALIIAWAGCCSGGTAAAGGDGASHRRGLQAPAADFPAAPRSTAAIGGASMHLAAVGARRQARSRRRRRKAGASPCGSKRLEDFPDGVHDRKHLATAATWAAGWNGWGEMRKRRRARRAVALLESVADQFGTVPDYRHSLGPQSHGTGGPADETAPVGGSGGRGHVRPSPC